MLVSTLNWSSFRLWNAACQTPTTVASLDPSVSSDRTSPTSTNQLDVAQMKRPLERKQWHDLETLRDLAIGGKTSTNDYTHGFTSIDRIAELQEILYLTKVALENYSVEDVDNGRLVRNELSVLRGYLVNLIGEFEDSVYEIDGLISSVHRLLERRLLTSAQTRDAQTDVDIEEMVDREIAQGHKQRDQIDNPNPIPEAIQHQSGNDGQAFGVDRSSTRSHSGEFGELLSKLKRLGYKVEEKTDGRLLTSVSKSPNDEEKTVLLRLQELGLEIWPGKRFLR